MACLGILGLATEIIYEICNHLRDEGPGKWDSDSELCRLRAVCRHLNQVVEAELFTSIVVDVARHGTDVVAAQLESLVSGSCRASNFAKTLRIQSLYPVRPYVRDEDVPNDKETEVAMVQVRKYLRRAVMSLKNVTKVIWVLYKNDEESVIYSVMESLPPLTTDLKLYCGGRRELILPLHLLSGLRRITIDGEWSDFRKTVVLPLAQAIAHSPELSYLHVDGTNSWSGYVVPSLRDLFSKETSERSLPLRHLSLTAWDTHLDKVSLAHFKSLTSFTFHTYRDYRHPKDSRPLWKIFLTGGIRLEELDVDDVNGELMDFIASFSGLQRLTLTDIDAKSRKASDDLAHMFFRHALPMHCSSLHSLTLRPAYEGKWCFSEVNAAAILDCRKLSHLSVALQWEDYDTENDHQSAVHLLLVCAAERLQLRHLYITIAYPNATRDSLCGNAYSHYANIIGEQIKDHVMAFSPVDPTIHLPIIHAQRKIYEIVTNEEGRLCYGIN